MIRILLALALLTGCQDKAPQDFKYEQRLRVVDGIYEGRTVIFQEYWRCWPVVECMVAIVNANGRPIKVDMINCNYLEKLDD